MLVAGDVFDAETVPGALSGQLLARLKAYPALTWHLLPGNHDPGRAGGVWSSLVGGLPANVRVHLEAKPVELAAGVVLLPAPLMSKRTSGDPTAWMDGAPTSDRTHCASAWRTARCRASAAPATRTCRSIRRA